MSHTSSLTLPNQQSVFFLVEQTLHTSNAFKGYFTLSLLIFFLIQSFSLLCSSFSSSVVFFIFSGPLEFVVALRFKELVSYTLESFRITLHAFNLLVNKWSLFSGTTDDVGVVSIDSKLFFLLLDFTLCFCM